MSLSSSLWKEMYFHMLQVDIILCVIVLTSRKVKTKIKGSFIADTPDEVGSVYAYSRQGRFKKFWDPMQHFLLGPPATLSFGVLGRQFQWEHQPFFFN